MMSNAIGNINRMVPGLIEKLDVTGAEKAAAQVTIQGARYPEDLDRMTGL